MNNPYQHTESLAPGVSEATEPAPPPSSARFDWNTSLFLTVFLALVGACSAQVVSLFTTLVWGTARFPSNVYSLLWVWFAISGIAVCWGFLGGYLSLRRVWVSNVFILAFLALYSVTARVGMVSFGWPFQLHLGMVFGNVGLGVNLVGAGLIVWWRVIQRKAARPASVAGSLSKGDRPDTSY